MKHYNIKNSNLLVDIDMTTDTLHITLILKHKIMP